VETGKVNKHAPAARIWLWQTSYRSDALLGSWSRYGTVDPLRPVQRRNLYYSVRWAINYYYSVTIQELVSCLHMLPDATSLSRLQSIYILLLMDGISLCLFKSRQSYQHLQLQIYNQSKC
jgi:hypothetical protein